MYSCHFKQHLSAESWITAGPSSTQRRAAAHRQRWCASGCYIGNQFEYVRLHIVSGTVSRLYLLAVWPVSLVKLVTHFHTPDEKSRAAGPFLCDMGSTFSCSCPSALSRSLEYKNQIPMKKKKKDFPHHPGQSVISHFTVLDELWAVALLLVL